jgi:hypothetical protein
MKKHPMRRMCVIGTMSIIPAAAMRPSLSPSQRRGGTQREIAWERSATEESGPKSGSRKPSKPERNAAHRKSVHRFLEPRAQLPRAAEPPRRHLGDLPCKTVGRYRKFVASATAKNPVDPFIDPEGYRAYIDTAEAEFRLGVVH